jgi:transcriptional regulator with GAF, ATPase, and Fis domain
MVCVNCAAIPEALIEAELFGHTRGAFTGAVQHRVGRFEQANRSTIFLDEVGDLPLSTQGKLLRLIQERELQPLGSGETVKLDVRVIAATNANLEEMVEQKRFREDLFYRLNVVPVKIPPLRDRRCDIPLLAEHFIDKICTAEQIPPKLLGPEALERLTMYSWPGNVRQLEHAIELALVMSGDREVLYPSDFNLPSCRRVTVASVPVIQLPDEGFDFQETVNTLERTILEQALFRTRGNKSQAAQMLRMKRTTLSAKVRALEIENAMEEEVCCLQ